MIPVKSAISHALEYGQTIFGDSAQGWLVEEVEQKGKKWYITLGFDNLYPKMRKVDTSLRYGRGIPALGNSVLSGLYTDGLKEIAFERKLKLFIVNAETGEVEGMKIKEIA